MPRKALTWTCRRVQGGVQCGARNPNRKQLCEKCRKPRQRRETSKDRHMAVLRDLSYEECIVINGGEHCGICGCGPGTKRLHRDHEHAGTGEFRGLLCFRHNIVLRDYMTLDLLRRAVAYLERFEQRRGAGKDGNSGEGTEEAQDEAQAARAGRSGP